MNRHLCTPVQREATKLLLEFMRKEGEVVDCPSFPVEAVKNPPATWTLVHELEELTLFRYVMESDIPELQNINGNWSYVRTGWFVDHVTRLAELELSDFLEDVPDGLVAFTHPCPVAYDGHPIFPLGGPRSKWLIIGTGTRIPALIGELTAAVAWREANRGDYRVLHIEAHEIPDAFCELLERWKCTLEGIAEPSAV